MTSLNPTMRVGPQVSEAAGGAGAEIVESLLAETGIRSLRSRRARTRTSSQVACGSA